MPLPYRTIPTHLRDAAEAEHDSQIVGLRMKRTATMAWQEDNAEALLQLRCLCASDAWDRFWGFDVLWRHIRTRAA